MTVEESPLRGEEYTDIGESADAAFWRIKGELGALGLSEPHRAALEGQEQSHEADPDALIHAIAAYIALQRERAGGPVDDEVLAYELGHLLALAMNERLGWPMIHLTSPVAPEGSLAVRSPDRGLCAYPPMAVYIELAAPTAPNLIVRAVEAVRAGSPPPHAPDAYVTVLGDPASVRGVQWLRGDDEGIDVATKEAQRTFRYFWRELSWESRRIVKGLDLAVVKAPFESRGQAKAKGGGLFGWVGRLLGSGEKVPEAGHKVEHMWIRDVAFDGRQIKGVLVNEPHSLHGWRQGDEVEIPLGEISDWMYALRGEVYGGFTVQSLRERMSAPERAAHDNAWGLSFPEPGTVRLVPDWGEGDPDVEHPMSDNIVPKWAEQFEGGGVNLGPDATGWTMLHHLALAGSLGPVDLLLTHGADPGARTPDGQTPLSLARALGWSKVEARLLEAGAEA